ncbi:hypothetical protein CA951_35500 [Rhodococcus sp. NCIMB 12038]|nr:hypothetical protein CA951_35500 [Rhodococcus sp. NCIMB 12038]
MPRSSSRSESARTRSPHGSRRGYFEPGSGDEIERAYYRGLLTDDEIGRLTERNKGALEQAARSV